MIKSDTVVLKRAAMDNPCLQIKRQLSINAELREKILSLDSMNLRIQFFRPDEGMKIQGAISELSKGKTVIIIAHRLATIEAADQILVVDDGRIIEKGKHSELVNLGGKYAAFVRIRQEAENWQIA